VGQVACDLLLQWPFVQRSGLWCVGLVLGKEEGLAIRGACEQHPVCVAGGGGSLKLGS
jgi:hypothetical protein